MRYAIAMLDRAPFLLAGQWTTLPPESYSMVSGVWKQALWAGLLLLVMAVPAAMWPLLRANRQARFWLIGMYLSVLPVCATAPMSRALVFIAIGAFGLIGELAGGLQQAADWMSAAGRRRVVVSALAVALLAAHLPWAAVRRVTAPKVTSRVERRMTRTMVIHLLRWRPGQDLVVVNAPNPAALLFDPFRYAYNGGLLPAGIRALAPGFGPLEVTRTQPRRLVVRAVSGSLLRCAEHRWLHSVFFYQTLSDVRGPDQPMRAGQRILLPRMTVEVMRVDERGSPVEVAFEFPVDLEDRSLRWVCWNWRHYDYMPFRVPAVGQTVTLDGPF
jgi:hypothetical protein